jgi:FkbM family methyltransferase
MGVKEKVKSLLGSLLTARRINRESELPQPFRSEVVRALFQLNFVEHLPQPAPFAGYEAFHLGEGEFRYLFNEIFAEASYLFKADTDCPIIVDCGSNIGMSILFFKKLYPSARIIGFEPDPLTYETLKTNIEHNRLSNVLVHPYALGERDEMIDFYRAIESGRSDLRMSMIKERNSGFKCAVNCRKLSSFIDEEIDLLKMDIEGAEHQVLRELSESGKLRLIRRVHLEYHHHIDGTSDLLSKTIQLLEDEGFGYQLKTTSARWPTPCFQDVSIYCYRKGNFEVPVRKTAVPTRIGSQ